jgi:hypothetical protein
MLEQWCSKYGIRAGQPIWGVAVAAIPIVIPGEVEEV